MMLQIRAASAQCSNGLNGLNMRATMSSSLLLLDLRVLSLLLVLLLLLVVWLLAALLAALPPCEPPSLLPSRLAWPLCRTVKSPHVDSASSIGCEESPCPKPGRSERPVLGVLALLVLGVLVLLVLGVLVLLVAVLVSDCVQPPIHSRSRRDPP